MCSLAVFSKRRRDATKSKFKVSLNTVMRQNVIYISDDYPVRPGAAGYVDNMRLPLETTFIYIVKYNTFRPVILKAYT